jgi:hypothetical protein
MARKKKPSRGYQCRGCGEWHDELPLHYGAAAPLAYFGVPYDERDARCELNRDLCVIDGQHFFIVGNLEIPVTGLDDEKFSWDVWVSLSRDNFIRAHEVWNDPDRSSEPPYFGWLSTRLPGYPDTINLKTHVHTREIGRRPFVELEPTDHPLAVEQRTGITWERVQEIAELVLHGDGE